MEALESNLGPTAEIETSIDHEKAEKHHRHGEGGENESTGAHARYSENALEAQPDANTPITYLYLEFETSLPTLPHLEYAENLPPVPDLKKFSNPKTWSPMRKLVPLILSCVATFCTAYSAGSYSPPSRLISIDLGTSHLSVLVGITTFCMGFGLAPMALAPMSEIWGRYIVFVVAGIIFVVFEAVCALAPNLAGMLVARFLVGCGSSVFSSVVGGVLADVYDKAERNTPMSYFSFAVISGTGAGPLVAAGIVNVMRSGTQAWKWSFWHQAIAGGVLLIAIIVFFHETRGSVLLSRQAAALNKWYEALEERGHFGVAVRDSLSEEIARPSVAYTSSSSDPESDGSSEGLTIRRVRWKVQADEERASLATIMSTSIRRPFYLLFTEPIVFAFSLWAAFAWGVLYLAFAVVPYLHGNDFNASMRTYIAMIGGSASATAVSIWQEELLKHPKWRPESQDTSSRFWTFMRRRFPADSPDARLYFACITASFLPAGLFGAFMAPSTGQEGDRGTNLAVGMGFATWGIYSVYLASFNYLADMYQIYASSALAANSFCRNLLGGGFPLATAAMFNRLGVKGAGGLLAGLATVLTVIPWVLVFWGDRIRARSHMALLLQK
ncbi:unnamed protein product [Clonostachys chloroleuca]|uniref:Major facilitator superfamily (MFS) profile domain-containing protein n=1 Tax=Clonostachys chloroleuca TaxID=1926264 RepID=A0AA35MFT9_9HYPO|nr:unnamed protein product [Clonostachys chloroleuca]